jgi:hypothetical protein
MPASTCQVTETGSCRYAAASMMPAVQLEHLFAHSHAHAKLMSNTIMMVSDVLATNVFFTHKHKAARMHAKSIVPQPRANALHQGCLMRHQQLLLWLICWSRQQR